MYGAARQRPRGLRLLSLHDHPGGWGRSSACGTYAKPSTTISAASISPESASLRLDLRAASSPSKWNGAARTWWPSSSRKASAETSCRFRKRSLPRSGRSRSLACRASRTASGSSRGKQIKGDAHPRGHLQPAGDRRVRRRSVGLGAPALSVPDKNHLPMCNVLQVLRQDRPLRHDRRR